MTDTVETPGLPATIGYALLVLVGTMVLGIVLLPPLAVAVGVFETTAGAEAYFAWATLKGLPYVVGLSILSLLVHPWLAAQRMATRVALFAINVVCVWMASASVSLLLLG